MTAGPALLIVEDRGLIADRVRVTLEKAGFRIVAAVATRKAAADWVERNGERLDAAVLDIDLRGESAYPLAEMLAARGTPFVFLTGYGEVAVEAPWRDRPRVEKPFEAATLVQAVQRVLTGEGRTKPSGAEPVITPAIARAWDTIRESRNIITEARLCREALGRR